jgi:hypothetical protein
LGKGAESWGIFSMFTASPKGWQRASPLSLKALANHSFSTHTLSAIVGKVTDTPGYPYSSGQLSPESTRLQNIPRGSKASSTRSPPAWKVGRQERDFTAWQRGRSDCLQAIANTISPSWINHPRASAVVLAELSRSRFFRCRAVGFPGFDEQLRR